MQEIEELTLEEKIKRIIWNWAIRKAKRELAEKEERDRKAG